MNKALAAGAERGNGAKQKPLGARRRYLKTTGMDREDFLDHAEEVLGEQYDEFLARQL